jgi:hypothetical protein
VGADKGDDSKDFVRTARELNVTPHVASNDTARSSNLDRRTTRQPGLRHQPGPPPADRKV